MGHFVTNALVTRPSQPPRQRNLSERKQAFNMMSNALRYASCAADAAGIEAMNRFCAIALRFGRECRTMQTQNVRGPQQAQEQPVLEASTTIEATTAVEAAQQPLLQLTHDVANSFTTKATGRSAHAADRVTKNTRQHGLAACLKKYAHQRTFVEDVLRTENILQTTAPTNKNKVQRVEVTPISEALKRC